MLVDAGRPGKRPLAADAGYRNKAGKDLTQSVVMLVSPREFRQAHTEHIQDGGGGNQRSQSREGVLALICGGTSRVSITQEEGLDSQDRKVPVCSRQRLAG